MTFVKELVKGEWMLLRIVIMLERIGIELYGIFYTKIEQNHKKNFSYMDSTIKCLICTAK